MKRAVRILSLLSAVVLAFSCRMSVQAAGVPYTYTVTFSAGEQGTLDADGISVDGGGDYSIASDGKKVTITGLTAENHVRFLNSAVKLGEDSKYYVRGVRMGGRDNDTVDLAYFAVERDQDYVVAYGIKGNLVQYIVNYEDAEGNVLYPPQIYYGNVGDRPVVAYLYVEGYQPQAYNLTRTLQEDASRNVFTFVYTAIPTTPVPQPPANEGGNATPAPTPEAPAPATPSGTVPEAPQVPDEGEQQGNEPEQGQPDTPDDNTPGLPEEENIPDNEIPQDNGPENMIDLDEEEVPLGSYPGEDDGTIAAANRANSRNAIIAGGIGLLALIILVVGVCIYRKMRKTGTGKSEE